MKCRNMRNVKNKKYEMSCEEKKITCAFTEYFKIEFTFSLRQ